MQRLISAREKALLASTGALAVLSVLFSFVIHPALRRNVSLGQEIAAARHKLVKYSRLLGQREDIEGRFRSLSANLEGSLKHRDPLVAALSELEALAKKANIKIIDIRPDLAARSSGAYRELSIEIRAEGDTQGYLAFIYQLENSLSLLRIKRFQISAKPNSATLEGLFTITQISAGSGP